MSDFQQSPDWQLAGDGKWYPLQENSLPPPRPPIHPPSITFVEVVKSGYRDWSKYNARSSRREFWLWALHVFLISLVLNLFGQTSEDVDVVVGFLLLPTMAASLSMWVRRIHDTGHRIWWCLIPLVNIVLLLSDTDSDETRWSRTRKT